MQNIRTKKSISPFFKMTLKRENIYYGNLVLINQQNPLQWGGQESKQILLKHFQPVAGMNEMMMLDQTCAFMFNQLVRACKAENKIVLVSALRNKAEQERIYADSLKENGLEFTSKYVARPNESEHQTGLAVDVGEKKESIDFIRPSFTDEGICKVFLEKASKYGFIRRYEKGKEDITGIAYEPWHFRYVGYPHSEIIRENQFCLEEYISYIKQFSFASPYLFHINEKDIAEIYFCQAKSESTALPIKAGNAYQISGNNQDGFIVTIFYRKSCEING